MSSLTKLTTPVEICWVKSHGEVLKHEAVTTMRTMGLIKRLLSARKQRRAGRPPSLPSPGIPVNIIDCVRLA